MNNLKFQAVKKAELKTDLKSVVSVEYHDFLDIFLKKDSDILLLHRKYNHKIILEEKQKDGHATL